MLCKTLSFADEFDAMRTPIEHVFRSKSGIALVAILLAAGANAAPPAEERGNLLGDPFLAVTDGIPDCPRQQGPMITRAEMHAEEHVRTERGTRCYLDGRCRLPNAYLYDKEIIPRVKIAILAAERYSGTSIWIEGQRRWVTLKGCVRTRAQALALEQLVRQIDDVEAVIDELVVKPAK
jgi:hypothetical protein